MSCHRLWYFTQIPYLSKFRATLFGISRFCTKCKACFIRIAHRQRLRQTDLGWQPNIDLTLATLRTTYEHIFYITVFNISYRFHICQSFEQHFSGSWDFVRNVKHVFHPLILIFNYDNLTHNPWTHILYHRLWYFIQIAFETDVGKNILFGVDAENFSAQSTHSELWEFSRKTYRETERSYMLFWWFVLSPEHAYCRQCLSIFVLVEGMRRIFFKLFVCVALAGCSMWFLVFRNYSGLCPDVCNK